MEHGRDNLWHWRQVEEMDKAVRDYEKSKNKQTSTKPKNKKQKQKTKYQTCRKSETSWKHQIQK